MFLDPAYELGAVRETVVGTRTLLEGRHDVILVLSEDDWFVSRNAWPGRPGCRAGPIMILRRVKALNLGLW